MKLALVLVAALAVSGCAGPVASVNHETYWTLTSATDAAGEFELDPTHPVTLNLGKPQGGTAACNTYSVSISGGPGPVTVSPGAQTEMACSPASVMKLESRYLAALSATNELAFDDGMTLTGPDVTLEFIPTAAAAALPFVGTEWHLVALTQDDAPDTVSTGSSGDVTVTFREDGLVDILGTCNDSSGDYTLEGDRLTVRYIASNGVGCSPEIDARDSLLFDVLRDSTREQPMTLNSAQLVLTGADGVAAFTAG